jgi:hypothetical protein
LLKAEQGASSNGRHIAKIDDSLPVVMGGKWVLNFCADAGIPCTAVSTVCSDISNLLSHVLINWIIAISWQLTG